MFGRYYWFHNRNTASTEVKPGSEVVNLKASISIFMLIFLCLFQKVKIMEAPSATVASGSPPFLKTTLSRGLAAPIHRKARILTRDPLREADDSMELQVEDDARRLVLFFFK